MRIKLVSNNLINRFIAVVMVLVMTAGVCGAYSKGFTEVKAATDTFEESISGFPESYKPYLRNLHKKYPKWKFVPYNTGIDFNTAVSEEFKDDKSLIQNSYSKYLKSNEAGDYNTSTGAYIPKDGATWVTASKNCIAYFLDPRNFLNTEHIYMFEQLSYDEATQTQAGVEAILQGSFMHKTEIGYITTKGKYKSSDILYSKQILDSAKSTKVSAYYLASKILQEIGTSKNFKYAGMGASGSISGTYSEEYTGIYNFYNIGASSSANPIANGLKWASSGTTYQRPWKTPFKSILGGAQYIGEKYINCGQNTTYYQRFNVNKNSDYPLYTHQYMTNIYGAASEASYTSDAYESLGITSLEKTFVIPVYNNMPDENNTIILGAGATKSGVTTSSVNIRKGPSTLYDKVITLDAGDEVTVTHGVMTNVEFGTRWLSNPYWYRITFNKNGKKYTGYVSAAYINLKNQYSVIKGKQIKIPVTLKSNEVIYYMSDNPKIATVNSTGIITGKTDGSTIIRAFTASGKMSATAVCVMSKGCVLDVSNVTLNVGKTKKLKATVYPTNSANQNVTYTSSNKSIAKVSAKGKITAKAPGVVTIAAKAEIGGASSICRVTVVQPVTQITLNKTTSKMTVGQSETLKATVYPANASDKTLTWKSSDLSIAQVSTTGVVTAKSAGTVTITATSNNKKTVTCSITVVPVTLKLTAKSKSYNSIKLSWPKTDNITGYWIYRKNSSGKYKVIATVSGSKSSYTDKNLVTGQSYSYKIKAYRTIGTTKYKGSRSKAVSAIPVPGKTKITSIISSGSGAALTWKTISGASGYEIYRSESKNGTYKRVKTIKKQSRCSYTNKNLVAGKSYYYKIVAYRTVSGKRVYGKYSKKVSIKK